MATKGMRHEASGAQSHFVFDTVAFAILLEVGLPIPKIKKMGWRWRQIRQRRLGLDCHFDTTTESVQVRRLSANIVLQALSNPNFTVLERDDTKCVHFGSSLRGHSFQMAYSTSTGQSHVNNL
jgi:hypothetical protein